MFKTSEWVSPGHPDKVADYISSFLLDRYLEKDPMTRYAVEVQIKNKFVTLGGEVTSEAIFGLSEIADFVKQAVNAIGYTKDYQSIWGDENTICGDELFVKAYISQQSPDIAQGVKKSGWGDQGIFWGMAVNSPGTDFMPKDWCLARKIGKHLYDIRYAGIDIKTQVTMGGDKINEVVVAIPMTRKHYDYDVANIVAFCCDGCRDYDLTINGTGRYIQHGPIADCGTTGRKLAVDFYGGNCRIGGGCVDAETEYLASDGWHKISEYHGGKVAQVSEDLEMSFVEPERYIQTESDEVYDLSMDSTLSMVLSSNHNVFYRTSKGNFRKKSLAELMSESAVSAKGSHAEIPRFFKYDFSDGTTKCSEATAQLLIAHCADGTVMTDSEAKYNCRISVKRQRKIERLRWILQRTGMEFTENTNSDGFTRFYYHLDNPSKLLSDHFQNPDMAAAKLLVKETLLWDGSEKLGEFRTTLKSDADFMQFVFSGVTGNAYSIITREKTEPGYATLYIVRMVRHRFCSPFRKSSRGESRIKRLERQKVFCFTVPTGLLLLRRKNYIFVTGNSPWTKDGTKADLSLNLLARARAVNYIEHHPDCTEIHCAISCRIGSPQILVVFFNERMEELLSCREEVTPGELIKEFRLDKPIFAEMCRNGLFSCL